MTKATGGARRVAIVTGGAKGIGAEICTRMAAAGHVVRIADLDGAGGKIGALPRRKLIAQGSGLFLELADAFERIAHFGAEIIAAATYERGEIAHERIARLDLGERALACDRLDTTYTGSDAALGNHLEETDIARTADVRAATELHRKITDTQHANA